MDNIEDKNKNFQFDDASLDSSLDDINFDDIGAEFEEEEGTEEDENGEGNDNISFDEESIEGGEDNEDINFDEEIIEDGSFADNDGTVVSDDTLLGEEDYEVVSNDADFISDTGDIVVMDTSEKGDNFKLVYVDIENIAIVHRIRKNNNVEDLVRSIKSTGLLHPIMVAPTATEGLYVLLNGYRRILACARAGKRRIPCIVNTKVNTPEIPVLEALYNHSKAYSIKEMVEYIDYLEKQKGIMSASMIEYLLQMNSGDYTKLKDILNDDDEDIVTKLYDGIYTIEMAFKKLEQRRKKESAEEKDLKKAAQVYGDEAESGADNIVGSGEEAGDAGLSDEEIKGLAISAGDLDDGLDDTSLSEMVEEGKNIEGFKDHKQDPNDRERLDPVLRKSVLARDENTCQICKTISGQEYIDVLDVHHVIEVYLGGNDNIENLLTACVVCHKLVHLYARGELYIRPLEELTSEEQDKFKRVVKLGTIIRKGMALKGMKKEQLKKVDNAGTIGRRLKGSSDQVAG